MKDRILQLITLLVVLMPAAVHGQTLTVAVPVHPLAAIATAICDDAVSVETVVPSHADPHHFEPTPSVVRKLQRCRVYFGITPAFDGWVQKFLPPDCRVVFLMRDGQENEHIWLTLAGGDAIGTTIAETMKQVDPPRAALYDQRLAVFRDSIRDARIAMARILSGCRGTALIQYHDAWRGFAAEWGLTVAGTVLRGHGHQPSPGQLMALIRTAREQHIRIVVTGLEPVGSALTTLLRETGARQVRLDPLGAPDKPGFQGYPELLISCARQLAEACQ